MKQSEIIATMKPKELRLNIFYSQLLLFGIAIVLGSFFFNSLSDWINLFELNAKEIFVCGIGAGIVVVVIELVLYLILPNRYFDDGGINKKIFYNCPIFELFILTLCIAFTEELLFRGVLQTKFGLVIASGIFILAHTRYLKRPLLLSLLVLLSIYLGLLYEWTGNLFVPIATHFTIDFLLGVWIRSDKWGATYGPK